MVDLTLFHEEGYQILRKFIPLPVLEETGTFLEKQVDLTVAELLDFFGVKDRKSLSKQIIEMSKREDFNQLEHALQLKLSGHFSLETRLSPQLLNVAKLPAMKELFKQIFPHENPRLHMPPTARFVLPHNAFAGVPPHQDVSYNRHIQDFFVLWVPFTEITDQKGGVRVFKGTQHKQIALAKEKGFWLPGVEIDDAETLHCTMQPGDALLLNKWIVHSSMPNLSDEVRISTDFRFFYGKSDKHFYDYATDSVVAPSLEMQTTQ